MADEPKQGFFSRLWGGLTKSRDQFSSGLSSAFQDFTKADEDFFEKLEEVLIMGDLGVDTTEKILDDLREKAKKERMKKPEEVIGCLKESIKDQMREDPDGFRFLDRRSVILVVGVNGVGKTTTIGKLARKYKDMGKKVILGAADTFRAAATEQLTEWAQRAGVEIVSGQEGADPGSVVFDAVSAAKSRDADILLVDTAGRLHNKKNLMAELGKLYRIIGREYPDADLETFIVLDGTTGQNALAQAKAFNEAADITGIILTKLDGTAKGGIAIAVQSELQVPVKYIGVGEKIEDLQEFDPDAFVDALFEV
ncbi:MAG: signal recognition particle-docking protein FtsY [Bilifractor sp.]|jgi:fused signal recognition particle receptor